MSGYFPAIAHVSELYRHPVVVSATSDTAYPGDLGGWINARRCGCVRASVFASVLSITMRPIAIPAAWPCELLPFGPR